MKLRENTELNEEPNIETLIPTAYHKFLPLFTKIEAEKLPLCCYANHKIILEDRAKPGFGPLHSLPDAELERLEPGCKTICRKLYLLIYLISRLHNFTSQKKESTICVCVDYQALN